MKRLLFALLLASPAVALAQDPIPWITEPKAAVNLAQQRNRPIMVYVLAGSRDRDDDIERDQRRTLSDPRVLRLVSEFIPLRLSRSVNRDVLADFGLPESANMMMSFVAPDGTKLGTIGAGGITEVDSTIQKLEAVLEVFRRQVYETQVKPVLEDPEAKPDALRTALRTVREWSIIAADAPVLAILERARVEPVVRKDVYETLATLSTKTGITKLLELGRAGDGAAMTALESATPLAAEMLIDELKSDAQPFEYGLYRAINKMIANRKVKPERFFENAKPKLVEDELATLRKNVESAADRWRNEHGQRR